MVREIVETDLNDLLELYLHLHETSVPEKTGRLKDTWKAMIRDEKFHIIVNEIDGKLVSSCICLIIPNLTRGVRPYALVENVVTNRGYRGHGYATECLQYAKHIAEKENCYKIMLMTGSKEESILKFYEKAGYNRYDKTGFVQWL